jgi:hypothetical protein
LDEEPDNSDIVALTSNAFRNLDPFGSVVSCRIYRPRQAVFYQYSCRVIDRVYRIQPFTTFDVFSFDSPGWPRLAKVSRRVVGRIETFKRAEDCFKIFKGAFACWQFVSNFPKIKNRISAFFNFTGLDISSFGFRFLDQIRDVVGHPARERVNGIVQA